MAAIRPPPDFKVPVRSINEHIVRYLLIGGCAAGFHRWPHAAHLGGGSTKQWINMGFLSILYLSIFFADNHKTGGTRRLLKKMLWQKSNLDWVENLWMVLKGLLEAAKPEYWSKPLTSMLLAATYAMGDLPNFPRLLYGVLIVGPLLWGGLYLLNDITDQKDDSQHPVKRFRPFPSGRVDTQLGIWVGSLMIGIAMALGLQLGIRFTLCLVLMCIKQLAYTLPKVRLKERFFWDVVSGSLGNSSLRFSAGWFLFTDNLNMPFLLLFFGECVQIASFFVNRLFANYGTGVERQLHYSSTTTNMSTRQINMIIAICGGAGTVSFILLSLNGQYRILPPFFGELPIQSLAVFFIILFCLPFLTKTIRRAEKFSSAESRFYYGIPMLIAFVVSGLISFIIKYYG